MAVEFGINLLDSLHQILKRRKSEVCVILNNSFTLSWRHIFRHLEKHHTLINFPQLPSSIFFWIFPSSLFWNFPTFLWTLHISLWTLGTRAAWQAFPLMPSKNVFHGMRERQAQGILKIKLFSWKQITTNWRERERPMPPLAMGHTSWLCTVFMGLEPDRHGFTRKILKKY